MAKNKKKDSSEKKGTQKPSFGERVSDTFNGIRRELKRVVWPNRKTMRENTAAVLVITVVVTLLLFLTDTIMVSVLDAAGFNRVPIEESPVTQADTSDEEDSEEDSEEADDAEDADDADSADDADANDETSDDAEDQSSADSEDDQENDDNTSDEATD